jgi:hypothetical protein
VRVGVVGSRSSFFDSFTAGTVAADLGATASSDIGLAVAVAPLIDCDWNPAKTYNGEYIAILDYQRS